MIQTRMEYFFHVAINGERYPQRKLGLITYRQQRCKKGIRSIQDLKTAQL